MKVVFKIFGGLLAFIFCIVLLIIQLATHLIFFSSSVVSENGINKIIDNIDISLLLEDSDGNKTAIYNDIAGKLNAMGLSEGATERILKSEGFNNVLSSLLNNVANYYVLGKTEVFATKEEIDTLVDNNIDNILESSGVNISTNNRLKILSKVKEGVYEVVKSPATREDLIGEKNLQLIQFALSDNAKIMLFSIILLITLLIALVKWNFRKAIRDNGIVTVITAALIMIFGLFVGYIFIMVAGTMPRITDYVSVLNPILRILGNMLLVNGAIALAMGIIFLAIASLIRRKISDNEEDKALKAL